MLRDRHARRIARHRDGRVIYGEVSSSLVRNDQGQPLYFISQVQDITERRDHQAQLERQANHDQLTGLPRRHLLADRLNQAMRRADRSGAQLALVFIDGGHALDDLRFRAHLPHHRR